MVTLLRIYVISTYLVCDINEFLMNLSLIFMFFNETSEIVHGIIIHMHLLFYRIGQ